MLYMFRGHGMCNHSIWPVENSTILNFWCCGPWWYPWLGQAPLLDPNPVCLEWWSSHSLLARCPWRVYALRSARIWNQERVHASSSAKVELPSTRRGVCAQGPRRHSKVLLTVHPAEITLARALNCNHRIENVCPGMFAPNPPCTFSWQKELEYASRVKGLKSESPYTIKLSSMSLKLLGGDHRY